MGPLLTPAIQTARNVCNPLADVFHRARMLCMISRRRVALGVMAVLCIASSAAKDRWVVRKNGFGPAKIGMSLSQLNTALHEKFVIPPNKEDQGCFYVNPTNHPHVSFMIENGRFVRIDVDKAGIATAEGVQVGDSEEHAKRVYGSRLSIGPHHYTDGHFLTVRFQGGGYGIRFETDKGEIETFYAGTLEAIQYVEGCQ
jgi:hypothetical protein